MDASASAKESCASSITQRYLENWATYVAKQAELLTEVELKDKDEFLGKIEDQTQTNVRLKKEVDAFLIKSNEISCLPKDWRDKLLAGKDKAELATETTRTKLFDRKEDTIKQMVAHVNQGLVQDAAAHWKNLSESDKSGELSRIITLSYNNTQESVKHCIKFLWQLPLCSYVKIGNVYLS